MVGVLLADGFEEVEAIMPIDFLRRAGIEVRIIGIEAQDGKVRGAHDITVAVDSEITHYHATPRYLILPGGMPGAENLARSAAVRQIIVRVRDKGGVICAICAAPAIVLAPLGYLTGRRFTCYPSYRERVSTRGEYQEQAVVCDEWLITSRGAGTAAQFSAEIIARIKGRELAEQIMRATIHPPAPPPPSLPSSQQ